MLILLHLSDVLPEFADFQGLRKLFENMVEYVLLVHIILLGVDHHDGPEHFEAFILCFAIATGQ